MKNEITEVLPIILLKLLFSVTLVFIPIYIVVTVSKFFSNDAIFMQNKNLDRLISVVTTIICIVIGFYSFQSLKADGEIKREEAQIYKQWCLESGGYYNKNIGQCEK